MPRKISPTGKRFSSKELRECYRQGAGAFRLGADDLRAAFDARWRPPHRLGSGDWRLGILATAGDAKAVLTADGKLTVASATADIGTGTYTIMTQIAAETLGLPIRDVTFQLGDSRLPQAPVEGGSFTAATVGSAVQAVCRETAQEGVQACAQDEEFAAGRSPD